MIIAVVGSGGKTTLVKKLAARYRSEGKKVFVTTTTHMFLEPDILLTDDAGQIIRRLEETGYAMAGIPDGIKIKPLSPETYAAVCPHADVVLVEADGSRHHPLKYPNATEPVIPENTEQIIVVWGPHGLGKPLSEACHRPRLAMDCLAVPEDTLMTPAHVRQLLQRGYLIPLSEKYPRAQITVYPSLS